MSETVVKLDKVDVNMQERSCVVLGKGGKEREVYFDARTKIHLKNYLNSLQNTKPLPLFATTVYI